jgi:hypothetical protein
MFNNEKLVALQSICVKINNLCAEQVDGNLTYSQMIFLGSLIKEFMTTPIVLSSGIKNTTP